jgi:exosortase
MSDNSVIENGGVRRMAGRGRLPLVVLVIVAASHTPLVLLHFRRLWQDEHYRYFPFVLLAVAYLFWTRFGKGRANLIQRARELLAGAGHIRTEYLVGSLLLLTGAVLLYSPWLAAVSAVVLSLGIVRQMGGPMLNASVMPVWVLLWLLIPLPFGADEQLSGWLQGVSSRASSQLLDLLGYKHLLTQHVFHVPGHQFSVDDACSGIRSLFTLVAAAAVMAVCTRRSLIRGLLLVASAGYWAFVMNAVRVAGVLVGHLQFGVDLSTGILHDLIAVAMFVLAAGMLVCTDQWLEWLFAPMGEDLLGEADEAWWQEAYGQPDEAEALSDERRKLRDGVGPAGSGAPREAEAYDARRPPRGGSRAARPAYSLVLGACFAALGIAQLASPVFANALQSQDAASNRRLASCFAADTLPPKLSGWTRKSFASETRGARRVQGRHSVAWTYHGRNGPMRVSFDFPFLGWHHVPNCYQAQGWEIVSVLTVEGPTTGAERAGVLQVGMKDTSGTRAWLLVSEFDRQGRVLAPLCRAERMETSWWSELRQRVVRRLTDWGLEFSTYQLQMLVTCPADASGDDLLSESVESFVKTRAAIRECLVQCG